MNVEPFPEGSMKAETAAQNRRRVQRMKEEQAFLRGIKTNFQLKHLSEIRTQLLQQKEEFLEQQRQQIETSNAQEVDAEPEGPQFVRSFSARARCIEAVQGGATLWTGEADGTIGVRNGVTGELVYCIEKTENMIACTLCATESHMWVGMSDGTIRIYDHLVFILAFEGKGHKGAVTAFARTFDGKMFSSSADGTIIKWDSEANNFDIMARITDVNQHVYCLACYGYNLFVGGDANVVSSVDIETSAAVLKYVGHTGKINAVVVVDGFLFTASEDGTAGVWTIDGGERIQTLEHDSLPVCALLADPVGHRVWSSDSEGNIFVWSSLAEQDFGLVSATRRGGATSRTVDLKGIVAVDTVKVWSLGSDGENKVWQASVNRVKEAMRSALDAMTSVAAEDEVQLGKWHELIQTKESVAKCVKERLALALKKQQDRKVACAWYRKWALYVILHRAAAKKAPHFRSAVQGCRRGAHEAVLQRVVVVLHAKKGSPWRRASCRRVGQCREEERYPHLLPQGEAFL